MRTKISRALLSVYDKTGIVEFARELHELGVDLVSSGGTAKAIADAGLPVTAVDDITGVPPILDHRVVTLHPKIHGGILADRSKSSHDADMATYGIEPFDLVVSNLYPFANDPGIETIDVGGPAMVRAAAKNHAFVDHRHRRRRSTSRCSTELDANDDAVDDDLRRELAIARRSRSTAALRRRDRRLAAARRPVLPTAPRSSTSRSSAPARRSATARTRTSTRPATAISGTTSWWDAVDAALGPRAQLPQPLRRRRRVAPRPRPRLVGAGRVAIIKHANPCGVALADDLATAYQRALECDERSAFGGIVALNRPVDAATVERMVAGPQADVVIAPGYEPGTVDALIAKRKNTRLLDARRRPSPRRSTSARSAAASSCRTPHHFAADRDDWRVVTKRAPTDDEWRDAELAWRICGHVKSNAIVLVKDGQAVGIGAGQQNRVESGEIAAKKAAGRAAGRRVRLATRSTRSPTASRRPRPPVSR